ncbi:BLUF domain-containing protein [Dietzia sp. CH92]|uniref:BLUF domain-containing protein n=1 Tax=Dietzia sp. CH92 TaxID=3051823 RepID=UPI0028D2F1EA|nr:BLUF domain-containing protein [Dietzia sp. CH92]
MSSVAERNGAPRDGALKYLVYTSTASREMRPEDFESILRTARERNRRVGITGVLLFRDDCFIQFLEGPPAEIDALLDDIAGDDRHERLRVLLTETTTERSFADWRMGFGTPRSTRSTGTDGVRDSFIDLTAGEDEGVVRQAAEDFSIWFKVRERSARV